jgi:hypothetical protein
LRPKGVAADGNKRDATHGVNAPTKRVSRIVYVPREDATPEGELAALATAYAFILKCHEQKEVATKAGDNGNETGRVGEPLEEPSTREGSA